MPDSKRDFDPEPFQECAVCGDPWLVSELNSSGLCMNCEMELEDLNKTDLEDD